MGTVTVAAVIAREERRIAGDGTPDAVWQAWPGLAGLPPVDAATLVPPGSRAIIVAPHPDDEVLACGGLLQLLQALGRDTVLVAVTDGTGSHPGSALLSPADLGRLRPLETLAALRTLGIAIATGQGALQLLRAGLPDGQVAAHAGTLLNLLHSLLRPTDAVFVTSRRDGHPDHEACGHAAAAAAASHGATLVEMPVWSWHWAAPADARLPWHRARRLALAADVTARKRAAAACFHTQIHDDPSTGNQAILPPHVLARLLHPYEIYFL
jgi:LmbE family N-acetylglucosaminyl deacetylase